MEGKPGLKLQLSSGSDSHGGAWMFSYGDERAEPVYGSVSGAGCCDGSLYVSTWRSRGAHIVGQTVTGCWESIIYSFIGGGQEHGAGGGTEGQRKRKGDSCLAWSPRWDSIPRP